MKNKLWGIAVIMAIVFSFAGCENGTNSTDPAGPNLTALRAKIAEAEKAKEGVTEANNASQVAQGRKWVTSGEMAAFIVAINTAKAALNSSTQTDVDNAVSALSIAIDTFNTAKKDGNKTSGFTQQDLSDLIDEAQNAKTGVKTSSNGKDVSTQEYWVTSNVMTALDNAIASANTALTSGSYDNAYNGLVTALDTFYTSKKLGTAGTSENTVYEYTFGEIGADIPANGMTLDEWCLQITGGDYAQLLASGDLPGKFYKNKSLTQEFKGNDTIKADTPFYCDFNLFGGEGYERIGTLTGTITLTDVPNPAPRVYISVNGGDNDNWWGSEGNRITISGSGTVSNISWSISIYGDNGFSPSTGNFRLWVESAGSNSGFRIEIPTTPYISSANQSGINLGTVSIKSITLSGTINVTYDGQPVPYLEISANTHQQYWIGSTELTPSGANTSWSITIQAFSSPTEISFSVMGFPSQQLDYWDNMLFNENVIPAQPVIAQSQNITEISLNLGNISNNNLPGGGGTHPEYSNVTSSADTDTPGTLRYAINHVDDRGTITIDSSVTTIQLARELTINKNVTIIGNGVVLTPGTGYPPSDNSLILINNDQDVSIKCIHFKAGKDSSTSAINGGSAIYNKGSLYVESCIFTINTGNKGGAIHNASPSTVTTVKGCTFYNNSATTSGGAIYHASGTLELQGNIFYGNTAPGTAKTSGPIVFSNNGTTVKSNGYNVVDVAFGTGADQCGWATGTGDKTLTELSISVSPIDTTTFAPVDELKGVMPSTAIPDFPTTDFRNQNRTWPGAPGAVK